MIGIGRLASTSIQQHWYTSYWLIIAEVRAHEQLHDSLAAGPRTLVEAMDYHSDHPTRQSEEHCPVVWPCKAPAHIITLTLNGPHHSSFSGAVLSNAKGDISLASPEPLYMCKPASSSIISPQAHCDNNLVGMDVPCAVWCVVYSVLRMAATCECQ